MEMERSPLDAYNHDIALDIMRWSNCSFNGGRLVLDNKSSFSDKFALYAIYNSFGPDLI